MNRRSLLDKTSKCEIERKKGDFSPKQKKKTKKHLSFFFLDVSIILISCDSDGEAKTSFQMFSSTIDTFSGLFPVAEPEDDLSSYIQLNLDSQSSSNNNNSLLSDFNLLDLDSSPLLLSSDNNCLIDDKHINSSIGHNGESFR